MAKTVSRARARSTRATSLPPSALAEQRRQLARAIREEKTVQQLVGRLARARRRTGELLQSLAAQLPTPITLTEKGRK